MKLLTWNVLEGGADEECGHRLPLIQKVLRAERPDVAVLVEGSGAASPLAAAAEETGLAGAWTASASRGREIGVLAREPAAVVELREVASGGPVPLAVAVVRVPGLGDVQVVGAHLDALSAPLREAQAWRILGLARADMPTAVVGDLNGISHEDESRPGLLSRLPPHHVTRHADAAGRLATGMTRLLEEAGLVDAFRACNGPEDPGFTVPTEVPAPRRFGPLRLDYVFLSPDLAAHLAECRVVRSGEAPRASDHFAVAAVLRDA